MAIHNFASFNQEAFRLAATASSFGNFSKKRFSMEMFTLFSKRRGAISRIFETLSSHPITRLTSFLRAECPLLCKFLFQLSYTCIRSHIHDNNSSIIFVTRENEMNITYLYHYSHKILAPGASNLYTRIVRMKHVSIRTYGANYFIAQLVDWLLSLFPLLSFVTFATYL